jgi:hypothetical protein
MSSVALTALCMKPVATVRAFADSLPLTTGVIASPSADMYSSAIFVTSSCTSSSESFPVPATGCAGGDFVLGFVAQEQLRSTAPPVAQAAHVRSFMPPEYPELHNFNSAYECSRCF